MPVKGVVYLQLPLEKKWNLTFYTKSRQAVLSLLIRRSMWGYLFLPVESIKSFKVILQLSNWVISAPLQSHPIPELMFTKGKKQCRHQRGDLLDWTRVSGACIDCVTFIHEAVLSQASRLMKLLLGSTLGGTLTWGQCGLNWSAKTLKAC